MAKWKGFTLIEVSISLLLGSILLQALLSFYIQLYKGNQLFAKQVALQSEAYNVENYLRLYLRQAEKLRIVTTKGSVIEPLADKDVINESLSFIQFTHEVQGVKEESKITLKALEPTNIEENRGQKQLYYYRTSNLISNLVEDITVTYLGEIEEVTFQGIINKKNEENPNLIYTFTFTESIAHKQAYN